MPQCLTIWEWDSTISYFFAGSFVASGFILGPTWSPNCFPFLMQQHLLLCLNLCEWCIFKSLNIWAENIISNIRLWLIIYNAIDLYLKGKTKSQTRRNRWEPPTKLVYGSLLLCDEMIVKVTINKVQLLVFFHPNMTKNISDSVRFDRNRTWLKMMKRLGLPFSIYTFMILC